MRNAAVHVAVALVLLALACPVGEALGAEGLQERMKLLAGAREPVSIQADRVEYDRKAGTFTATGNVSISQGDAVLTADNAVLGEATGEAEAFGNARLVNDGNVLFAESIKVNFNTRLGVIEKGRMFVQKGNYHITGASLERLSEDEFEVVDGSLTTCDSDSPFWKAGAGRLNVRMDRDVTARDVVVRIKGVPVLYSPYAWFPLLKPRTTGFLLPGVGYSTKEGLRLLNSFYWAPVDNYDATLKLDYRSKRGVGVGAEMRLALDRETITSLNAYYMDDRKEKETRYNFSLHHQQTLGESLSGKAEINFSDRQFYRDLTETARDRTQRSIDSNVFLTNRWDWGRAYLFSQYTLGLDLNNDVTVQRLPELGFNVVKKSLFGAPIYLDMDGSAAYFYKEEGVKGGRLDVFPKLSGAFNLGGLNISPRVGYRETAYELDEDGAREFDDERGLLGAGVTVQTGLQRLYTFDEGFLEGVRHTFEPLVAYNYVIRRGGADLPKFDGVDTLGRKNMVSYSIINRLVLKYRNGLEPPRVDYVTVRLSQFYDLYGDEAAPGTDRHFSSLFGEVGYKAGTALTLKNDFRFDFYNGVFQSVNTDIRYDDRSGRWHATLGQRFSSDAEQTFMSPSRFDFFTPGTGFASDFVISDEGADKRVNFITAEAGVKLGARWEVTGKIWYDLHTDNVREGALSASYMSQCWGVRASYVDRPGERQFMVTLDLKGLGNVRI